MKDTKQDRYQGMTKIEYKRMKAKSCSTPGTQKNELCQASSLGKALTKYPRAIKTMPDEYFEYNLKKDMLEGRNSFFTRNK
jgi:hypothetical protein